MERQIRAELNELSRKVFGVSSKWQKMVNQGTLQPMQRERKAMIVENGQPVEKTYVDHKSVTKYFTVPEVKQLMLDILKEREEAAAKAKEIKDAILAKEAADKEPKVLVGRSNEDAVLVPASALDAYNNIAGSKTGV